MLHQRTRSLRVLHVNCVQDRDGRAPDELLAAWPTLIDVATAVRNAGAEVGIIQSSRHHDCTIERDGILVRFVSEPGHGNAGFMPSRLVRAARAFRPDVIHVNGLGFPAHIRALYGLRRPVLVQDHADAPRTGWRALYQRWGLAKAAAVSFTAPEQASPFRQARLLPLNTRVFAIPESSTHFLPGDLEQAQRITKLHGGPALLWVGRLNDNKDPLTIIDALSLATPALPHAQLWCFFHEAPLRARVEARLQAEPELARRVHLSGMVPHAYVEWLCRAADFFVLGSHREGSGYALIEALACGATPVVTDIPPFRALTGSHIGALIPPGDAHGFSDALVRLAAQPAEDLRRRTIAHFDENLSFAALGRKFVAAYQDLIRTGQP
jgi:glycosyltransferase involved in cell wall biosynthesis